MHRTIPLMALTLGVLTLGGMAGCSTNPATGRNQLLLVSQEQTRQMGVEAKPELVKSYGGEVGIASVRAYVTQVGESLTAVTEREYSGVDWEFTVLDADVINAFALPGGKVFISRGLLVRLENEAELAGVLGHEIGHVTARHVDERISRTLLAEFGYATVGVLTESDLAAAGAELFGGTYMLSFDRDQEAESDWLGMRYMTRAGYNPNAMLGVMEVLLAAANEGGSTPPEFLSTHPHPETRLENIQTWLVEEYAETAGDPRFRLYEDRFEEAISPLK